MNNLPAQVRKSMDRTKPSSQIQLNDPTVFLHPISQPPLLFAHSSMSFKLLKGVNIVAETYDSGQKLEKAGKRPCGTCIKDSSDATFKHGGFSQEQQRQETTTRLFCKEYLHTIQKRNEKAEYFFLSMNCMHT